MWSTVNDTSSLGWRGDIGNPAGSFAAVDQAAGDIWFFEAPSKFLGDQSAAAGETLSWDLLALIGNQGIANNGLADLMLTSGSTAIGLTLGVTPTSSAWTTWSATLGEAVGQDWRTVTSLASGSLGASVDAAVIDSVLSDLDGLFIRGEFTNGSDSVAIDNVVLVPTPASAAVASIVGVLVLRRRRA